MNTLNNRITQQLGNLIAVFSKLHKYIKVFGMIESIELIQWEQCYGVNMWDNVLRHFYTSRHKAPKGLMGFLECNVQHAHVRRMADNHRAVELRPILHPSQLL